MIKNLPVVIALLALLATLFHFFGSGIILAYVGLFSIAYFLFLLLTYSQPVDEAPEAVTADE